MNASGIRPTESAILLGAVLIAGGIGLAAGLGGPVALAVPLVVGGAMVLLARPVVGVLLFAAMVPVEAALMIGGRSLAALIGMAVFGVWVTQRLVRREPLLPLVSSGLIQLALLLLAFVCLSLLWSQYPRAGVRGIILLSQLILLAVLVLDLCSSWERVTWVVRLLVLAGLVAALLAMEQYFLGGARRAGTGIAGGINRTARTLVTLLPFAFFLFRASGSKPWRFLGLGYIGASAIAVVITFSRMNYLAFPLVVGLNAVLMARTRSGRRQVLALGVVSVLLVSMVPVDALRARAETIGPYIEQSIGSGEEGETRSARGYLMALGLEMFKDRPLLGSGFGSYRPQAAIYHWQVRGSPYDFLRANPSPHSSHMWMLVSIGSLGFAIWIGLFVVAMLYVRRAARKVRALDADSDRLFLLQAIGLAVALQLPYGFYDDIHADKVVWLLLGLAAAVHRMTNQEHRFLRSAPGQARLRGHSTPIVADGIS